MGMRLFGCSSSDSYIDNPTDPNPSDYSIVKTQQVGRVLIALVNYPNCNNYEGNKILVFKDMTLESLRSLSKIDPHFTDSGVSPVLRVVPSDEGWAIARKCAKMLDLQYQETFYTDLFLCTTEGDLDIFFDSIDVSDIKDRVTFLKRIMNHTGSSSQNISDLTEYKILEDIFLKGLYR